MSTIITIPLELFFETDLDKLPNGAYCLGGPTGNSVNKIQVHAPEHTTTQAKLREILMAHLLRKLAESGTTGGGSIQPSTPPNTVEFVGGLFPTGVELSIESIRFRGAELALHQQELTAGDGYEVVVAQAVVCRSACACDIL